MSLQSIHSRQDAVIQFVSRLKLISIFPGEWDSIFRGEGIEFSELQPFEPGDSPAGLDLLTLAKSGEELIIQRVETRQMRIYIWADFSASMQSFPEMVFAKKPDIRNAAMGLILFSALRLYCPVGLYPFGCSGNKNFPPKVGEGYATEILRWAMSDAAAQSSARAGFSAAALSLMKLAYSKNIVFMISDFQQREFDNDFTDIIRPLTSRFDFIPVVVRDPLEVGGEISDPVRISVRGSSGKTRDIYLSPKTLLEIQNLSCERTAHLKRVFRKAGADCVFLDSPELNQCAASFLRFFEFRRRSVK